VPDYSICHYNDLLVFLVTFQKDFFQPFAFLLYSMFFEACDGFFTNYNWTEENLEWMKDYQGVQGRQADIYVGIDVFARGKVVGGMFETNKVTHFG